MLMPYSLASSNSSVNLVVAASDSNGQLWSSSIYSKNHVQVHNSSAWMQFTEYCLVQSVRASAKQIACKSFSDNE